VLLAHKPNVEHAIFAYAAEKGGAHARYGKVPAGYAAKPAKQNPASRTVKAKYHALMSAGRFEDAAALYTRSHAGMKRARKAR
jgi:hypothetical protein